MSFCEAGNRYSAEFLPYLDEGSLLTPRREVEYLRHALLGVQMRPLYCDIPAGVVNAVLQTGLLPVSDAARRVSERLKQRGRGRQGAT